MKRAGNFQSVCYNAEAKIGHLEESGESEETVKGEGNVVAPVDPVKQEQFDKEAADSGRVAELHRVV
jgi:hypothetical protein